MLLFSVRNWGAFALILSHFPIVNFFIFAKNNLFSPKITQFCQLYYINCHFFCCYAAFSLFLCTLENMRLRVFYYAIL